jgi:signal transduction histidine kinase
MAQTPRENQSLTNLQQIWELPRESRSDPHKIRFEAIVYYFDAEWNVVWGECAGKPTVLPIGNSPVPLQAGDRILLDGVIIPSQQRFLWDQTQITALEHGAAPSPQPIPNLIDPAQKWNKSLVTVEGLIDREVPEESPAHLTFRFQCGDSSAIAYVLRGTDTNRTWKTGDYVRVKAVYFAELDREGKPNRINLYVASPKDIEVIGHLASDPRFAIPVTAIDQIQEDISTNDQIRVEGIVRSFEPGKWLTLWDETGQVMVQTPQTQLLRFGDRVEAIGYPYMVGIQQCLRSGLCRLSTNTAPAFSPGEAHGPLRLAARIQEMDRAEAQRHQAVNLRGVITWSHPSTPFIYMMDASGGVRVMNPNWQGHDAQRPGSIVSISGAVAEGDFVPVVTNAVATRLSYWNIAPGPLVSLEQALTGAEDGRWIQMRGLVRSVTHSNQLTRLDMGTSSGEFEVWTPTPTNHLLEPAPGSIIRAEGVCAVTANARHQVAGIQIWAAKGDNFQVEEPAPIDLFAAELRTLGDLRRFSLQSDLNRRVRTAGAVALYVPGEYLCVQDGADSVFALCEQTEPLQPGDRVELVGFPGRQGRKFVLRDAVFRRVSSGAEPAPLPLRGAAVNPDLQGLLVKARGSLLNIEHTDGEWRLLIEPSDAPPFKAVLPQSAAPDMGGLRLGSKLSVTGVYETETDEVGTPRSFQVRLRTARDLVMERLAPWWTLGRMLALLSAVLVVLLIGLVWAIAISRKNSALAEANTRLREAQGELQTAHDQLEVRVSERTRELREQVSAKERARADLAQAQNKLIVVSRQAGMAEVATGILHNVGNVLNSVNVSATLIRDRIRQHRAESVGKVASLLQQPPADLGHFLTEDTKGKTVPDFLAKLGHALVQDKRELETEVDALTKNVEHINAIVSMQQNYAKAGGIMERLDVKEVVEDSIQINACGLERHDVRLRREFQPVPLALIDRHKVLQILINLVNNAKYAVDENTGEKEIVVSIACADEHRLQISVADNGAGIAAENLDRIFSQGFTTRKHGHGFGLHSGALAAKELGGSLSVRSPGLGLGATFTLEIPLAAGPADHPGFTARRAA